VVVGGLYFSLFGVQTSSALMVQYTYRKIPQVSKAPVPLPDFKGFQSENPQVRPARITDELFNEEGGIDVMFLQKPNSSAPTISQAEMNRVIQSIRKVPAATVASNGSDQKSMSIALR